MFSFLIKLIPSFMRKKTIEQHHKQKQSFFTKLVEDDNNFSTINFFLVAATIVGIFLLIVPIIGILVDVWFNHTVTVNLEGMAQYIIAVAGIFGAAGLTNAWTDYSYKKYNTNIFQNNGDQNVSQNTCGIDLNNDNNIDFRELHDDCRDA